MPLQSRMFAWGLLLVGIALPWLWLAWLVRPGAERPPVSDVIWPFIMFAPFPVQFAVEQAVLKRAYRFSAIGIAASLISNALLALRLRSAFVFLLLSGLVIFIALLTWAVERFWKRPERATEA